MFYLKLNSLYTSISHNEKSLTISRGCAGTSQIHGSPDSQPTGPEGSPINALVPDRTEHPPPPEVLNQVRASDPQWGLY